MDVLVLSPCSRSKRYDSVIDCEMVDSHSRTELVRRYPENVVPAAEMYTGREHQHIREAVEILDGSVSVDWYIISAGFGLLRAETEIPPYDCGFSDIQSVRARAEQAGYDTDELTNDETIQAVGRNREIPQDFADVLQQRYDLLFVVLSEPYLLSVTEALTEIPEETTAFSFASAGSEQYTGDCIWIPATDTERRELETTWMELRGKQLRQLVLSADVQQLEELSTYPEKIRELAP